ncbi:MAG: GGDEF domain-containing protein [Xanthomonadaceae bacterium]|jgi:diguanylate cyclase (GGDEF)-like protein|nr:GGDEF domain-containing protein [Xanthomonadaceae bacterium]
MSAIPNEVVLPGSSRLDRLLVPGGLYPVYQPLVRLADFAITAHEGLIRVEADPPVPPLALFDLARAEGRLGEVELLAARRVLRGFGFAPAHGRLLLNLSATALMDPALSMERVLELFRSSGIDPSRVVVELSERDIVADIEALAGPVRQLRAFGAQLALDDFGSGHSNFSLWQVLGPEYVKLDRSIIHGMAANARQLAIVRALMQVAEEFGTELIAEGIELEDDLALVRDLGIRCGQGYALARPARTPLVALPEERVRSLPRRLPVPPTRSPVIGARELVVDLLRIDAPALTPDTSNQAAADCFRQNERLHALAVVDEEGRPIGLINRRVFMERIAQPFAREIFGRKPCTEFMHPAPLCCEAGTPIGELLDVLRGEDQRYLTDGFVITRQGRYQALGTGESLVRRISEMRVEAARYANPLTLLPGNIPITLHLERLLEAGIGFTVAYADLNHFKPFNDQYGYFRGDAMIQRLAHTLREQTDPRSDFLGHVGGDDFVVVFQSGDWRERCRAIVAEFNESAKTLFDAADVARGGIEAEDRQGRMSFFPLTTLSIGVVVVPPGSSAGAERVASAAAAAKRRAKHHAQPFIETDLEG